jgi:hypothetical protein
MPTAGIVFHQPLDATAAFLSHGIYWAISLLLKKCLAMNTKTIKLALAWAAMALASGAWAATNSDSATATATVVAPLTVA